MVPNVRCKIPYERSFHVKNKVPSCTHLTCIQISYHTCIPYTYKIRYLSSVPHTYATSGTLRSYVKHAKYVTLIQHSLRIQIKVLRMPTLRMQSKVLHMPTVRICKVRYFTCLPCVCKVMLRATRERRHCSCPSNTTSRAGSKGSRCCWIIYIQFNTIFLMAQYNNIE